MNFDRFSSVTTFQPPNQYLKQCPKLNPVVQLLARRDRRTFIWLSLIGLINSFLQSKFIAFFTNRSGNQNICLFNHALQSWQRRRTLHSIVSGDTLCVAQQFLDRVVCGRRALINWRRFLTLVSLTHYLFYFRLAQYQMIWQRRTPTWKLWLLLVVLRIRKILHLIFCSERIIMRYVSPSIDRHYEVEVHFPWNICKMLIFFFLLYFSLQWSQMKPSSSHVVEGIKDLS